MDPSPHINARRSLGELAFLKLLHFFSSLFFTGEHSAVLCNSGCHRQFEQSQQDHGCLDVTFSLKFL